MKLINKSITSRYEVDLLNGNCFKVDCAPRACIESMRPHLLAMRKFEILCYRSPEILLNVCFSEHYFLLSN